MASFDLSMPDEVPTPVDVAFVMNQFVLRHCVLPKGRPSPSQDNALWKSISQALQRDRRGYCQQLADVIVQMSSRTTEGKLVNCQLEVFLSACISLLRQQKPDSEYHFPCTIEALELLPEPALRKLLTELIIFAADYVFTGSSGKRTSLSSSSTCNEPQASLSSHRTVATTSTTPRASSKSTAVTSTVSITSAPSSGSKQQSVSKTSTTSSASRLGSESQSPPSTSRKRSPRPSLESEREGMVLRKSSRIASAEEANQLQLLEPIALRQRRKEQHSVRRQLALSQHTSHVYLVALPPEFSRKRRQSWTHKLTPTGSYSLSLDDIQECVRSSTSVLLSQIEQSETAYHFLFPDPTTCTEYRITCNSIDAVLFEHEVLNLISRSLSPSTLAELICVTGSNYAAMRALSLAGEAYPPDFDGDTSVPSKRPGKHIAATLSHPPHHFYFFTSPIGYYVSLCRYVVQQVEIAREDCAALDSDSAVRKQREQRIQSLAKVLVCLDKMKCNITTALTKEQQLHEPYTANSVCFPQPTELDDLISLVVDPSTVGPYSKLPIANAGVLRSLRVTPNEFDVIEELFETESSLSLLGTTCYDMFCNYPPNWDYPQTMLVTA